MRSTPGLVLPVKLIFSSNESTFTRPRALSVTLLDVSQTGLLASGPFAQSGKRSALAQADKAGTSTRRMDILSEHIRHPTASTYGTPRSQALWGCRHPYSLPVHTAVDKSSRHALYRSMRPAVGRAADLPSMLGSDVLPFVACCTGPTVSRSGFAKLDASALLCGAIDCGLISAALEVDHGPDLEEKGRMDTVG